MAYTNKKKKNAIFSHNQIDKNNRFLANSNEKKERNNLKSNDMKYESHIKRNNNNMDFIFIVTTKRKNENQYVSIQCAVSFVYVLSFFWDLIHSEHWTHHLFIQFVVFFFCFQFHIRK